MCAVLLLCYLVVLSLPFTREFFELALPTVEIAATGLAGAAIAVAGLELMGLRRDEAASRG
jgi:hypothetical protein